MNFKMKDTFINHGEFVKIKKCFHFNKTVKCESSGRAEPSIIL